MATGVGTVEAEIGHGAATAPYPRSWIDAFFAWMTALPGPTWLAYAMLVVPSVLVANAALWLSGLRPWGVLEPVQVFWGTWGVLLVAATHHLRNVAGDAFDRFRVALGDGVDDAERARYELTVTPATPVLVLTVVALVLTPLYYLAAPEASQVVGLTPIGLVPRTASEGITTIFFLAITLQAVRQLRAVGRLHAVATGVDVFRPAPLHAFSRLTAQTGIVLTVFISVGILASPDALGAEGALLLWLPWLVGIPLFAAIVFVVPLLGMHRRLEDEKERFEAAADGRMRALLGELNEAIDARAADRVAALDATISALRHEREILARLPTWPWSTVTIRGFGSALLLPIALFLIQRYLGAILGA